MHILVAPNAFKHSLSAAEAAKSIAEGLLKSRLQCTLTLFPVGDGGDGTGRLLVSSAVGGSVEKVVIHDPLGRNIEASFGLIDEGLTAVIELADAAGLRLLQVGELDPLHASTFGVGELILAAVEKKVTKILLCIGGSCTTDGGSGLLRALGVRFLDVFGNDLQGEPESLLRLDSIDCSSLDSRVAAISLVILCDVNSSLLGPRGTAAVFGPQKGATGSDVILLESCLKQFRDVVFRQWGADMAAVHYGGAAGGVSAGLSAVLGAQLVSGIDYFLDSMYFDQALEQADLLITAEGSIDLQTLEGKAPFGVARRARRKRIPVLGLTGSVPMGWEEEIYSFFDVILPINHAPVSKTEALGETAANLTRTARTLGNLLSLHVGSFV